MYKDKPRISDAVAALTTQEHGWDYTGDCILWRDTNTGNPPTRKNIDAKLVELQTEWDAQEYARNRQAEYPDWGTQLNKIYDDGIEKWKSEMVDPIKAKYPKP